jgi:hypothetical protein
MARTMKATQRVLHKEATRALAGATKRYKKFMRQAAKAANDYKREQYVAAALGALVVTGMVANKLRTNLKIAGKAAAAKAATPKRASRKKRI